MLQPAEHGIAAPGKAQGDERSGAQKQGHNLVFRSFPGLIGSALVDALRADGVQVTNDQKAEAAVVADPESGIDFSRVVHADERFTHHRPIVAGDELIAELTVDSVRAMGDGALLTTRSEISTTEGEKVATAVSSILVRGEGQ